MKIIVPEKIKRGDEIRIIAPSRSMSILKDDVVYNAKRRLEKEGFKVSFGRNVLKTINDDFKCASIKDRIEDLHDAYKDKNVKMIITAIGGYNVNQLLDYIDYNIIQENPKIICGFSDITALVNAIYAKTGVITYLGVQYFNFGMKYGFEYSMEYFKKIFTQNKDILIEPSKEWSNDKWMKEQQADEKELQRERDETFPYMPKISLVVPVFNTPIPYLDLMLDTVVSQSYENWELCIADGSDENHPASAEVRKYAEKDKRIRVMRLDRNYGISGNTNKAMELVSGEYTALYDHDDFLERNALYEVVKKINEENSDIIYTDEDKYLTDKQAYFMPAFKPDFSIDLLRSDNYICHFLVIRTELLHQVGGFRSEYDGSQDYDLILRCVEKAEHISHIPKILYHWRMYENSTSFDPASKLYAFEAGQRAIEAHLERVHINARVSMLEPPYYGYYRVDYVPKEEALVSIIIPNKDQKDVLDRCVQSLLKENTYHNIEIIIAENNSTTAEIKDYYAEIQAEHENVHVVDCSMDHFNYAAINNKAVKHAHGKYLLFLNNDTEIMDPESIRSMLGIAERDDVGIVGARLLYENNTVQHAGVILSHKLNAVHAFAGLDDRDSGYMVRLHVNTDYSAVTGACMMMRRDLFEKVNGFDEKLAVAYNDVDLCLKVRKENKLVVYDAFASWHHYESLSRGYDVSEEKKARLKEEGTYLQNKWKDVYAGTDPYYNPNFDDERPFELKLK